MQGARTRHARKVAAGVAAGLCVVAAGTLALANVHIPDGRNLPRPHARVEVKKPLAFMPLVDDEDATAVPSPDAFAEVGGGGRGMQGTMLGEREGYVMGLGVPRTSKSPPKPSIRKVSSFVSHGLPADAVDRVVRLQFGRLRACYEAVLAKRPDLAGDVEVLFSIQRNGSVAGARGGSSTLADPDTVRCIAASFGSLTFPVPDSKEPVYVSYRIALQPP